MIVSGLDCKISNMHMTIHSIATLMPTNKTKETKDSVD